MTALIRPIWLRLARIRAPVVCATVVCTAGALWLWQAPLLGAPEGAAADLPALGSAASLTLGKAVYLKHCALCHGEWGKSDGVAAPELSAPPANLQYVGWLYTPEHLFEVLSEGHKQMRPFYGNLTEPERWHLVHFVKTLGRPPSDNPRR